LFFNFAIDEDGIFISRQRSDEPISSAMSSLKPDIEFSFIKKDGDARAFFRVFSNKGRFGRVGIFLEFI